MKVEKIKEEKKKNKLMLLIKDSDEAFANVIRRLIIEEVPTLAVEDVELKENSSALYDEMLALRIGLVPIKTDLKSYVLKEECKCNGEGCARCELKINLKAGKKGYVYAEEAKSTDPKCTFVYEKMPLVKLLSKQKVDIAMTAILGQGKNHSKFTPGLAFYKKEPVIKIGKVQDAQKIAAVSSDGLFTHKNNKLEFNEDKLYTSNLLEYYAEIDSGITLDYTKNIIFNVESWGQLSCKEMLQVSAEILEKKAEQMESLI